MRQEKYCKEMVINTVEKLVEDTCKLESNIFGYGIWSHHIIYVVKYAKMLAEQFNADGEIVVIASLLHDYAGILNKKYHEDHHIYGAKFAEEILTKLNYPNNKIEKIKQCILSHRGSVLVEKKTPEEICVASADAMAHIDQVVPILYARYIKFGESIEEGKLWTRKKLDRTWNKLCPEAKNIIKEKYLSAKKVLE
ncbi:MAG: HD domain-containing protein [bacterium]